MPYHDSEDRHKPPSLYFKSGINWMKQNKQFLRNAGSLAAGTAPCAVRYMNNNKNGIKDV